MDAACHAYSMASVPLYDTLGPDSVEYICNHAELAAVACSVDVLPRLLEVLPRCASVKLVVRFSNFGFGGFAVPAGGPAALHQRQVGGASARGVLDCWCAFKVCWGGFGQCC